MPFQKLVNKIFAIAQQVEERGGINDAANLRRGAKIFELKHDLTMLQRCLTTAKSRLAVITKKNENHSTTR